MSVHSALTPSLIICLQPLAFPSRCLDLTHEMHEHAQRFEQRTDGAKVFQYFEGALRAPAGQRPHKLRQPLGGLSTPNGNGSTLLDDLLAKVLEHGAVALGVFPPIEITGFHHLRRGSARARLLCSACLYHRLHLLRTELSVSYPLLLVSSIYHNNGGYSAVGHTPYRSASLVPSAVLVLLVRCSVLHVCPTPGCCVALWLVGCFRSLLPRSFARGALLSHSFLVPFAAADAADAGMEIWLGRPSEAGPSALYASPRVSARPKQSHREGILGPEGPAGPVLVSGYTL